MNDGTKIEDVVPIKRRTAKAVFSTNNPGWQLNLLVSKNSIYGVSKTIRILLPNSKRSIKN